MSPGRTSYQALFSASRACAGAPVDAVCTDAAARRVAAAPVHTASTGAPAHARIAEKSGWYVVRPGDTLYSIAQRHDAEVGDLQRLNRLSPHSVLRPGEKLRVPQAD